MLIGIITHSCYAAHEGEHPIFSAIEQANIHDVRQILVCEPAAATEQDICGKTPLHVAACKPNQNIRLGIARNAYLDIMRILIEAGADVNSWNCSSQAPLHLAALNGYLDAVQLLVANGADLDSPINAARNEHPSPIYYAAMHSCTERRKAVVDFLLLHGALVDEASAAFLESKPELANWREVQRVGARRILQALEWYDESQQIYVPHDVKMLLLSFLSRAWGPGSES